MLSNTFPQQADAAKMERLSRGICRAMLAVARIPQSHIGSLFPGQDGSVALANRLMFAPIAIAENENEHVREPDHRAPCIAAQTVLCRTCSSSTAMCFFSSRTPRGTSRTVVFRWPSWHRCACLCRSTSVQNTDAALFFLQFTDLHASNILVDDAWNVTDLVDLEWICALPREMLVAAYWLTGCSVDTIIDEEAGRFNEAR